MIKFHFIFVKCFEIFKLNCVAIQNIHIHPHNKISDGLVLHQLKYIRFKN